MILSGVSSANNSPLLWKLNKNKQPEDQQDVINSLKFFNDQEWVTSHLNEAKKIYDLLLDTNLAGVSHKIVKLYQKLLMSNPNLFPQENNNESGWTTVKIGNKERDIPKNLLSAQGDYFRSQKSFVINSPTNKDEDDASLLNYLSKGDITLKKDNVFSFLHFAHVHTLVKLKKVCFSYIEEYMDLASIENVFNCALNQDPDLIKLCLISIAHKAPSEFKKFYNILKSKKNSLAYPLVKEIVRSFEEIADLLENEALIPDQPLGFKLNLNKIRIEDLTFSIYCNGHFINEFMPITSILFPQSYQITLIELKQLKIYFPNLKYLTRMFEDIINLGLIRKLFQSIRGIGWLNYFHSSKLHEYVSLCDKNKIQILNLNIFMDSFQGSYKDAEEDLIDILKKFSHLLNLEGFTIKNYANGDILQYVKNSKKIVFIDCLGLENISDLGAEEVIVENCKNLKSISASKAARIGVILCGNLQEIKAENLVIFDIYNCISPMGISYINILAPKLFEVNEPVTLIIKDEKSERFEGS